MSALRNRSNASPAGPVLVPVGQHQGQSPLPVSRLFTVVGSAPSARVYLSSKSVSRCHAALINTGHGLFVRDLASRSGVRVNGRAVREADLREGDVLQFGSFTFRFTDPAPQQTATPAPSVPAAALEVDGLDEPLPVSARTLLIGRRETADVSLTESAASSAHALIFESEGKHLLRDLTSRTGTFVNEIKVHEHALSSGDVIRVGETSFRYVITGETDANETVADSTQPADAPAEETRESAAEPPPDPVAAGIGDFDFAPLDVAPDPVASEDQPVAPAAAEVGDSDGGPDGSVGLVEHGEAVRTNDASAAHSPVPAADLENLTAPWEVEDAAAANAEASDPGSHQLPDLLLDLAPDESAPDEKAPAAAAAPPDAPAAAPEPDLELELAPAQEGAAPEPVPEPSKETARRAEVVPPPRTESRRSKPERERKSAAPPAPPRPAVKAPPPPAAKPPPTKTPPANPPAGKSPAPKPPPPARAPVPPAPPTQRPARPRSPFEVLGAADELEPLPDPESASPPAPPGHEADRSRGHD